MKNKIKIIYFIDAFAVGGAETFLLNLCKQIDKDKFDISVVAVVKSGLLQKQFEKAGIKVKVFNKKSKLALGLIWQLRNYIKAEQPDIVHTNLFGADTWGRIAAFLAGVPIIISTEHNINLDESWLKKVVKFLLSYITTKIVAVSEGVRLYSIGAEKISPKKFVKINYGIDLSKFKFQSKHLEISKTIQAVVVGRLEPQKGHHYLIEAIPLILKRYPFFKLNIIGSGSLEKEYQQLVKKLHIERNVKFWGKRLNVNKLLLKMDLFILSSLWEGLGIAILEAQASGLPVLASDIPGVRDVIKDKKTGLLFAAKNPQDIFNKVDLILSDFQLKDQIVKNAYQQVKTDFSVQTMVKNYTDLYLNLVK